MFETAELGRTIKKKVFEEEEATLRVALLEAQRAAREADLPVLIIVSGVEGAGKGGVVNRLTTWLDARGVQVHAFWDETDEERERPQWWRFWRAMPPRGSIGVFFGSWYTKPVVDRAFDKTDQAVFEARMRDIEAFERMVTLDGLLIVKLWFHLSREAQHERYEEDVARGRPWSHSPLTETYGERYAQFARISEQAIRMTDTGRAPWHIIEATDERYRDLTAGRILRDAMQRRLAGGSGEVPNLPDVDGVSDITVLDRVDLTQSLDKDSYKAELEALQLRLHDLAWRAHAAKRSTVIVYEGWDAAGKGGSIRRMTQTIDARLARVIPIAAPTDEERAQHYLWRFWRHLPRDGRFTIYDRSWYGRVLVERVEGFASDAEWSRAYHEITSFEHHLVEHGVAVVKLWLHISQEEQLRRFEEREQIPWKKHKITEEDWRNRDKWDDYRIAVHDMVQRTSTTHAPWTLVPGNDKRFARVFALRTVCDAIERVLA